MSNAPLPAGPPTWQRFLVATVALIAGAWTTKEFLKNFEFIKYTPFDEEEVARRKKENLTFQVKTLDTCTLEYTPEARKKLQEMDRERSEERSK